MAGGFTATGNSGIPGDDVDVDEAPNRDGGGLGVEVMSCREGGEGEKENMLVLIWIAERA